MPSGQTQQRVATGLPAYEPPILPLHKDGLQVLNTIQTSSSSVEKYLTTTLQLLTTAASDLGERTSKDHEDTPAKAERQKVLDALELAARKTVDTGAKLQNLEELIRNLATTESKIIQQAELLRHQRAAERRQAGADSSDEDENESENENQANYGVVKVEEGLWSRYKSEFESRMEEYEVQSDMQKYVNVAEYKDFRRTLWDSQNPDTPVPPERTWFAGANAADDSDDDDDIQIAQEVQSYNCPLTMLRFKNPMRSTVCSHVFEKAAITEMIRRNRQRQVDCPVPGCSKTLDIDSLQPAPDIILKMQRRQKRMERLRAQEEDEDGDGEGEGEGEEEEEEEEEEEGEEEEEREETPKTRRVVQVKPEREAKSAKDSKDSKKHRRPTAAVKTDSTDEDEMSQ